MLPREILDFWFGSSEDPNYGKRRKQWFIKSAEFDRKVRAKFYDVYQQAVAGKLNSWKNQPWSCLALIIVLDQFSRNMFRGTPEAFKSDRQSLEVAKYAVEKEYDQQLLPVQRWFIYLPFEHSENLADQRQAVKLCRTLSEDPQSADTIEYAQRHLEVIERFGRFPHRNQILGRESTPEEREFLQQPGSKF